MAYVPPRKRRASPGAIADRRDRRRALELLAGCGPEGCTEAVLLANGFMARRGLKQAQALGRT